MGYYNIKDVLNRIKRSDDNDQHQHQYPPELTDLSYAGSKKFIEDLQKYYNVDLYNPNNNQHDLTYQQEDDYTSNTNYHNKDDRVPRGLLIFLGVVLAGLMVFLIIYTYRRCSQKTETVRNTNFCRNIPQSTTTNNQSLPPIQNLYAQNRNGNVPSDFERPLINNTNSNSNHLNLPPTYGNSRSSSLHNLHDTNDGAAPTKDSCALPPSYEEALANVGVAPSAPVCENNVTPTAPPCSNLRHMKE